MASGSNSHKDSMISLFPGLKHEHPEHSDNESTNPHDNSRSPGNPVGTRATNVAAASPLPANGQGQGTFPPPPAHPLFFKTYQHHRFLTTAEWVRVAHGLGALNGVKGSYGGGGDGYSDDDPEKTAATAYDYVLAHPTCWYWRPRGLPDGLYRAVLYEVDKNRYSYHVLSLARWFLLILQIVLGSTITALASSAGRPGNPVLVLAAINTVGAGVLGLMHNSGMPDRYRMNKVEFTKVEDFLRKILDTGIVRSTDSADDILSECFERFRAAKATVTSNMPEHYDAPPPPPPLFQTPPMTATTAATSTTAAEKQHSDVSSQQKVHAHDSATPQNGRSPGR